MAEGAIKVDQPSLNICQDTKTICVWRHLSCNLFPVISDIVIIYCDQILYQILNVFLPKWRKIDTISLVSLHISSLRFSNEHGNLKKYAWPVELRSKICVYLWWRYIFMHIGNCHKGTSSLFGRLPFCHFVHCQKGNHEKIYYFVVVCHSKLKLNTSKS